MQMLSENKNLENDIYEDIYNLIFMSFFIL